jgi:glycosyltransferase involved in cell wall biosynthesis
MGAVAVDYPLKRASISPLYDLQSLRVLVRLLKTLAPTVVLAFSAKPVVFGTLAAWFAGIPARYALVEGLGHAFIQTAPPRARLLRRNVRTLYRVPLARATRPLFLNDDDRRDFIDGRLVDEDKALTVGAIGIDLDAWLPAPPVADPVGFLFVGRLLREKGILEFVEAARRIKGDHPKVRVVVAGATDSNPSSVSEEEIRSWSDEGVVQWLGHVDVAPSLAATSVFVLPSYREGVPRSTQEAMAMAKPIVTTDVPGCRETVIEGVNGFLVPPRDSQALGDAMLRFVQDPTLIGPMGARSRELAEQRFDVRTATVRMIAAIGL